MLSGRRCTALPAHAQLFGPSDEEKAARGQAQDRRARIAQIQISRQSRIQELEDKVRSLTESLAHATGANEELHAPDSGSAERRRSTSSRRISPTGSARCRRSNWARAIRA